MRLAQLTRLSRIDLEREINDVRARIIELQSILDDPRSSHEVIKIRDDGDQGRVRHAASLPDRSRRRRDDHRDLVDDKELVIVMTEAQYVKSVPAAASRRRAAAAVGSAVPS